MKLDLLFGVIRAAHERTGFDMPNPARFALKLPRVELVGMDPPLNGEVLPGRLEVLAEGEDVAGDGDEVVDDGVDLVRLLAEAEHDAGLGDEPLLFGGLEELERAVVLRLRADALVEARDRFHVVVQDLRTLVEHELE